MYINRVLDLDKEQEVIALFEFVNAATNCFADTLFRLHKYLENGWLGYGCFDLESEKLVAYCFVKNPRTKPETTTLVHPEHRNKGLSYILRSFAISDVIVHGKIIGKTIYSAAHKDNISSIVSLLHGKFRIISISEDDYIHFERTEVKNESD